MTSLRKLPLDELVSVLVSEHAKMKGALSRARDGILSGDSAAAKQALEEMVAIFRQHIADEEGQVLRFLIDACGKEGAEDAIKVFRQHRPIYTLMQAAESLLQLASGGSSAEVAELARLLGEHTLAEEERVFPRALSAKGRSSDQPDSPAV